MKPTIAVCLAASCVFAACSSANSGSSLLIQGGTLVTDADDPVYRSTVALLTKGVIPTIDKNLPFCTGTVIGALWVVTAAHCIRDYKDEIEKNGLFIGNGPTPAAAAQYEAEGAVYDAHFNFDATQQAAVKRYLAAHPDSPLASGHPDPDLLAYVTQALLSQPLSDLALVKLKAPLPQAFAPAELAVDSTPIAPGRAVVTAGYGKEQPAAFAFGRLNKLTTVVAQVSGAQIETAPPAGHGGCHGDSGGPLYVDGGASGLVVVGAFAAAGDGVDCSQSNIYTDLRQYSAWISCTQSYVMSDGKDCPDAAKDGVFVFRSPAAAP